jgi:hypothetical protein
MVPVVLRHLEERDARKHSGIVDQSVDWTEPLLGRQHHCLDLLYPAHVGLDQDRAPAVGAYLVGGTLGGAIVIEPVDRHVGTRRGKFARHRTADPLLCPRDQNDLASQLRVSDSFDPDLDRDFTPDFDDRIHRKPTYVGFKNFRISRGSRRVTSGFSQLIPEELNSAYRRGSHTPGALSLPS